MSVFELINAPKVIFETQSEYNGNIKVLETAKSRKLVADGITQSVNWQSPSAEHMIWGACADLIQKQTPQAKKILILGLGGGTMQQLLVRKFEHPIEIVTVDIDQVMYDVARQYFELDAVPNHRVIIDDACRVIIEPEKYDLKHGEFDVVVVDIYCGQTYPELGKSGNFLSHTSKMVSSGGLVVINRIYVAHHQEDVDIFIESVKDFIRDVEVATVSGRTNADNVLIYGTT